METNIVYVRNAINKFFDSIKNSNKHTIQRQKYITNTWQRYMAGYFNDRKIGDITDDILDGYWDWRNAFYITGEGKERILANKNRVNAKTQSSNNIKKKFAYGTARAEASIINQFFAWCYRDTQSYTKKILKIKASGAFSKEELNRNNRRDNFTKDEWKKIILNLGNYVNGRGIFKNKNDNPLHARQRKNLRLYIMFLASTGARVGEAKHLRWKDVDYDEENDTGKFNIAAKTSKTRKQRFTLSHSSHIYNELIEWKKETEFADDNDLVFYTKNTNGNQKICDVSVSFKNFLTKIGLLKRSDNKNRTLYSLRHSYATMRLEDGAEVYNVAKNIGTSVKMIEQHYGHVQISRIGKDLNKRKNTANTEQAKDIEMASTLIGQMKRGELDVESVAKVLENISKQ
jgi:integrase